MKNILNKVRESKDASTVAKNFGYLTAMQIAGYVFPLLTIPYLARVIGVEKFGELAFAAAIVLWFRTISEWGFNYTATRDVAQNRDDKEKVSQILSDVLWARLFLSFVSFVLFWFVISLVPYLQDKKTLLIITFLIVPADIFLPQWFFQGIEKMRYITVFSVFTKMLFTAGVFLLVKEQKDFILQPALLASGSMISGVGAFYFIVIRWGYRIKKPKLKTILQTLKQGADIFLNTLVPNLYNSFSTVLLGFYSGGSANGILDAGVKFVAIIRSFVELFSRASFPFLSRKIEKHYIYERISTSFAFVFSVILYISAPFIIKLFFTVEFYEAIHVLRVLAFSVFFLTLSDVYGKNYLIIAGRERELRDITVLSSVIGFIIAWPLIYCFSFFGAAITIVVTRMLIGTKVMLAAKKIMRINSCKA